MRYYKDLCGGIFWCLSFRSVDCFNHKSNWFYSVIYNEINSEEIDFSQFHIINCKIEI